MQCPVCSVPLTMTERQGVEIDYCPQCRGVWLDRGELDKILERSRGLAPEGRPPEVRVPEGRPYESRPPERWEHRRDDDDDYHHRPRRRKSFLEELFD